MKKAWRKMIATVTMAAAVFGLTACGGSQTSGSASAGSLSASEEATTAASDTKTTIWRMAFVQTEDHPQYQVMEEFSEKFKEATNGRYEIQLFPNETLGDQRSTLEQVRSGTIEMTIVNNKHPGSVSDYFKTFDIPFVFENLEEAMNFMQNSPIMDTIREDTIQYGFDVAAYMPAGTRSMYTSKTPIHSVEDMKGLKIRTMESDTYTKM
ncbi:MAG: TRAP transporter substrate-binding protein DctP, partial [Clostridiales bacterium]|nr:TRAP transporter substrate-binding protein DctP [Clostridiales bacterium]